MKSVVPISTVGLFLISGLSSAQQPKKDAPVALSAPVACYQIAWGSKDTPGLGLNAGQAVELCGGASDAEKVIKCFVQAWAHVDDGGLGLNAGQAIRLCKANSQQQTFP